MKYILPILLILPAHAADHRVVNKIIACESSHRPHVWGDGGLAYGQAQFHKKTFNWMKHKAGMNGLQWKNNAHQVLLLHWALDNGYGSHWSCFRKLVRSRQIVMD